MRMLTEKIDKIIDKCGNPPLGIGIQVRALRGGLPQ